MDRRPPPGLAADEEPPEQTHRRTQAPPADPALAARLLDGAPVGPPVPRDGTLLGALFELLVALSVRVFAQAAEARVHHLRTKACQREIDFIIVRPGRQVVAALRGGELAADLADARPELSVLDRHDASLVNGSPPPRHLLTLGSGQVSAVWVLFVTLCRQAGGSVRQGSTETNQTYGT